MYFFVVVGLVIVAVVGIALYVVLFVVEKAKCNRIVKPKFKYVNINIK